ncbi:MAG: aminotransferase class I/II-fold pyridoxal phosphate-dependent enzyme [Firmicutes bacterium]|uniref:Aminotransferase class I/II-fold pyridoxal phosphate-dependent enzyme n=1 Tax=Candidatus Scybalomonas excrementavium TaxID=2840943 RepID=A0A9D9I171_9FIRM|nr:aminotransferase class I/II-fold pyridoxal phosphate-dependent enzyme [Candidatus Scybalomonas excrementavium]
MKPYLYKKLVAYDEENIYPFHMPGHKRQLQNDIKNPYKIDITEIDGFDNLNDPQDILRDSMKAASEFYGTKQTFYLVNGSTVGILSAISAVCHRGDKLLMTRNCHKAVYHAVRILDLEPVYLPLHYIEEKKMFGGVNEEKLEQLLKEHKDIKAVIVTSPTYEGIVINIKRIKMLINPHNIPLIVDEAHGAHFPFCDYFPKSAIKQGADIVIQSLHKTMPAFTQTALLHICSNRILPHIVQEWISMYQSSSPSYLLMAGIEYSIYYGVENKKEFKQYYERLVQYREKINQLRHISLLKKEDIERYGGHDLDISKLVLFFHSTKWTGNQISDILLNQYKIQMEMSERDYILAISTICDTKEGFEHLYDALYELDQMIHLELDKNDCIHMKVRANQRVEVNQIEIEKEEVRDDDIEVEKEEYRRKYRPYEASLKKSHYISLEQCKNEVCGSYIYLYPPGNPILVPGEVIEEEHIARILQYKKSGFYVKGIEEAGDNYHILVLKED